MKQLFFFILCLSFISCNKRGIENYCDSSSYSELIEAIENEKPSSNIHSQYFTLIEREIVANFHEEIIYYARFMNDPYATLDATNFDYKIHLIKKNNQIAYIQLFKSIPVEENNVWTRKLELVYDNKNTSLFNEMIYNYNHMFDYDLNVQELFQTDVKYGKGCGFAVTLPQKRKQMNALVALNKKEELINWLVFPNVETQIYGLEGLKVLQRKNVKISEKIQKIMDYVEGKKGKVFTCSVFEKSMKKISEIDFDSNAKWTFDKKYLEDVIDR
ncbi:hypothetical protein [Aureivirga marina]|uniref:hypothetical protein n=1 Tax=Aureivirga marina TaxID=1182451 RepID=UPI0018CB573A|nr:hypothetical protein [Aureivirga marina]